MAVAGYIIAIAAYVLMGISQLVDKVFLTNLFRDSRAFTCFVGLMNALMLLILPFGVLSLPLTWTIIVISLFIGASFILALLPFFAALQGDDASRIIPIVGSLTPIFVFLIERFVYQSAFTAHEYSAFLLLVSGSLIMTFSHQQGRESVSSLLKSVLASFLFALSFAGSKYVFAQMGFVDGFFWMRMGGLIVGLFLLVSPTINAELRRFFRRKPRVVGAYIVNQGMAGFGFLMQSYAIHISSVSIVSALQGAQYAFVLFFAVLASALYPRLLSEKMSASIITQKAVAVVTISAGLALLFL